MYRRHNEPNYKHRRSRAVVTYERVRVSARELGERRQRRAALTSRTTSTNHIQQLCPMNDCRVGSAASVEERTSNQQEHRAFYGQPWP